MTPTLRELVAEWERANSERDSDPRSDKLLALLDAAEDALERAVPRVEGEVVRAEHIAAVIRALNAEGER